MNTRSNILIIHCDVMKFKTVAIFVHGRHFNLEKSMVFRQFVCKISSWHKNVDPEFLNFARTQQIKFVLIFRKYVVQKMKCQELEKVISFCVHINYL